MNWFTNFLTSSIGRKLIMSLTGLFMILFLVVHLIGNLQLLYSDEGEKFNLYALFMTTFTPIKVISYGLYAFILIHAVQGWILWRKNVTARGPQGYAVKVTRATNTNARAASNMGWLGTIIFVFLVIHLYQFWLQMKMGALEHKIYDGVAVADLYATVKETYMNTGFVIFYVVSMVVIAFHLWHGFQSAFQTLGWNHRKYTPLIHLIGKIYSVIVPALFALIPLYMYFKNAGL